MKKITLLLLFLSTMCGYSQASSYSFSQTTATYTEITGGVSLGGTTNADVQRYINPAFPDGVTATKDIGLPIGFNFVYNGYTYDKLGIATDGWIALGSTALGGVNMEYGSALIPLASTNPFTTEALATKIAALGQDLGGQANATLRYETSGDAPNRVLTVQWKNYKSYRSSGSNLNFQIKLYETSNKIEFVYGSITHPNSNPANSVYQVGLRAEPSTIASNFANRTSSTGWNVTTQGSIATDGVVISNVIQPASGLTYSWTPATCGSAKNLAVSELTSDSAILSWGFNTPAPTGYEYIVTTSTVLPSGSGTATTAATASLTNLIPNTAYNVFTRSVCGTDFSIWSLTGVFRTKCLPTDSFSENFDSYTTGIFVPYCWDKGGNGIVSIANGSDFPGSVANRLSLEGTTYGNQMTAYAILPKVSNLKAETHRLKFKAYAPSAGRTLDVGYFTERNDTSSFVLLETVDLPSSAASALDFLIFPKSIPDGVQSLGFRFKGVDTGNSPMYIDDVSWSPIPACADVKSLVVDGILSTSANVKWTPTGNETAWQYAYGAVTLKDPSTLTPVNVTSSTTTISGLTAVTPYRVWVRANCGNGSYGAWIIPVDFTTTCTPSNTFAQNFDTSTSFPNCWKKLGTGTATPIAVTGTTSGTNGLKLESSATLGTAIIAMEPVNNTGAGTHRLKFRMRGSVVGATVQVGYLTNIYNASSFTLLQSFSATSTTVFDQANMTFGVIQSTPYLAFRLLDSANAVVYIDDVIWEPIPSCPDMTVITLNKVASTSVDFTWVTSGTEAEWQYVAGPATTTNPSTLTAMDFVQTPTVFGSNVLASVTGLTASTSYKIWLRSKCNASAFGVWLGPYAITTTCLPVTEFTQKFDVNTVMPSCWSKVGAGTASIFALSGTPSTPNVLSLTANTTTNNRGTVALSPVSNANAGTHRLRFKFRSSVANSTLEIGYLKNPSDINTFTVLKTIIVPSTTVFTTGIADLGTEAGSQVLAFKNASAANSSIYIDDVIWEPLPSCDDISALTLNVVGSNSVDISWTPGDDVTAWQYAVGAATLADPSTLNPVDVSSSEITVDKLEPVTAYKLWVRSICGSVSGLWSDPLTFTTNCTTVSEFTQNFDVNTSFPSCWTRVGLGGTVTVEAQTGAPSGANVLKVSSLGGASNGMIAMQSVSNISAGTHRLKFKLKGSIDNTSVSVGYLSNAGDPNSFKEIETFTASSTTIYENKKINIAADPKIQLLAFRNTGVSGGSSTAFIDNVVWEPIPSCPDVNKVVINGMTSTSANLSWTTDIGTTNGWQYAIGASTDTDPNTLTLVNITSAQVELLDLAPETTYKVWVRSLCGQSSTGLWSEPFSFTTTCTSIESFTQGFDVNTNIPACWRAVQTVSGVTIIPKVGVSNQNVLALNSSAAGATIIAMPSVSNIALGTYRLKFKFSSSIVNGALEVGYLININNPATFMPLATFKAAEANVFESKIALLGTNPPPGSTLAFRNPATSASYIYIDDVVWEPRPTCTDLANVLVKSVNSTLVQLSFDAIGTEKNWQYVVAPSTVIDPDLLPTSEIINIDVKTVNVEDLTPDASYKIWVRSNCGNEVYGAWTESVFHTPCTSVDTISENFDTVSTIPDCWRMLTTKGDMSVVTNTGTLNTNALQVKVADGGAAVFAGFPSLSTATTGNYNLKFKYKANLADTKIEVICYKNLYNLDSESSYTVLRTLNVATDNKVYSFDELIPATETSYLGLKVYNSKGQESIVYIDDFVWELPKPTTCVTGITKTPDANCGNYATALSWYTAPNAIGYKLTIGTTEGGSDVINNQDLGNVLSYSFTGKANTTYYFTVKPWNALGDVTGCEEQTFTTVANNCYCPSVPTVKDGQGITNVKLGGADFENPSVTYANHMSKPINVAKEGKSSLIISFDTGTFNYHNNVWIDFNDNFQFEPTEIVYQGQGIKYGDFDASFIMPVTATLGVHGMRIVSVRYEQFTADPCVSGPPGVTLDFKVNVVNPISNDEPVNAVLLTVGKEFATNAVTGSNIDATASQIESVPTCGNYNGSDVWYKAVVPASGKIIFEVNTVSDNLADIGAAVYNGNTTALTSIGCDLSTSGKMSEVSQTKIALIERVAGEVLYLRVWENGGDSFGSFQVSAYDDQDTAILGMDTFDENGFNFYPNPVNDILNLTMNTRIDNVVVVNLLGQQIINKVINENQTKIDMSDLSNGTYLMKVTAANQIKIIKVVKK